MNIDDLKRKFVDVHKSRFSELELIRLSKLFYNVHHLGCRYPEKTMEMIGELSKGIIEEYHSNKSSGIKRNLVSASDAALRRLRGRDASEDTSSDKEDIENTNKANPNSISFVKSTQKDDDQEEVVKDINKNTTQIDLSSYASKNRNRTNQEAVEPLGTENIGYRMLVKMGWRETGLGKRQQGIQEPVLISQSTVKGSGFGFEVPINDNIPATNRKLKISSSSSKLRPSIERTDTESSKPKSKAQLRKERLALNQEKRELKKRNSAAVANEQKRNENVTLNTKDSSKLNLPGDIQGLVLYEKFTQNKKNTNPLPVIILQDSFKKTNYKLKFIMTKNEDGSVCCNIEFNSKVLSRGNGLKQGEAMLQAATDGLNLLRLHFHTIKEKCDFFSEKMVGRDGNFHEIKEVEPKSVGSRNIDLKLDNIKRTLRNYAASNSLYDLIFTRSLDLEEKSIIRKFANKLKLDPMLRVEKGKPKQLVVTKRTCLTVLLQKLLVLGGENNKFLVIPPMKHSNLSINLKTQKMDESCPEGSFPLLSEEIRIPDQPSMVMQDGTVSTLELPSTYGRNEENEHEPVEIPSVSAQIVNSIDDNLEKTSIKEENLVKGIPLQIMAVKFPSRRLTDQEMLMVKGALFDKVVQNRSNVEPKYLNCHQESGRLVITCLDEATAEWTSAQVPLLKPWVGAALCSQTLTTLTMVFPNSSQYTDDKLMELLKSQNVSLDVDKWIVLKRLNEGSDVKLTFGVDKALVDKLKNGSCSVAYGAGQIPLTVRDEKKSEDLKGSENEPINIPTQDDERLKNVDNMDRTDNEEDKTVREESDKKSKTEENESEEISSSKEGNIHALVPPEVETNLNSQFCKPITGAKQLAPHKCIDPSLLARFIVYEQFKFQNNPIKTLKKSFLINKMFKGRLYILQPASTPTYEVRINGIALVKSERKTHQDAKVSVALKALKIFQETCYTIKETKEYVCEKEICKEQLLLESSNTADFGSTDYSLNSSPSWVQLCAERLNQLFAAYADSDSYCDLMFLGVQKKDTTHLINIMKHYKLDLKKYGQCSVVSKKLDLPKLLKSLKECGGTNGKYQLIHPLRNVED